MTADEYRAILKTLGLTQNAAARLLGVDERTSRRWALDERPIPGPADRFLRYLVIVCADCERVAEMLEAVSKIGSDNAPDRTTDV